MVYKIGSNIIRVNGGSGVYRPAEASEVWGLRFPSNTDSPAETIVAFRFTGSNALDPFPATYVWQAKFRTQNIASGGRYFTLFFYADTTLTGFVAQGYYGFHPYPNPAPNGADADWEISVEGSDAVGPQIVKDQWYTQAAVVRLVDTNELELKFYYDLPSTSNVISYTTSTNYANTFPQGANPGIVIGEAPWSVDSERLSGTLGPMKMFSTNLSESDIVSEAADFTQIVTSSGNSNRWWFKPTFESADDLTDSVTGKAASWYNSNKATREQIS